MKFSRGVCGTLAVIGFVAFWVHAQQAAEMKIDQLGSIEAGSTVTFTIKLDKEANVSVNGVSLGVGPVHPGPDGSGAGGGGGPINSERTLYRFPVTIPVTAHSGTWHVTNLSLNIPSAPGKQLKFNDLSFEIREKRNVVLPDSGSVEISK